MQAIIMAAGFGSRISEISGGRPKSFLKINNETLIERAVRLMRERGINDITVVTGYKEHLIREILPASVKTLHNPLYYCTNVLASFAVGMTNLSEDFIFVHADTIFSEKILDGLISAKSTAMTLPVDFKSCVEEEMKVVTEKGQLKTISKEIPLDLAEGEFIGVARISATILNDLKAAVKHELKEKRQFNEYFEAAIQNLVDKGIKIECMSTDSLPWVEIDFPEDYYHAKQLFEGN